MCITHVIGTLPPRVLLANPNTSVNSIGPRIINRVKEFKLYNAKGTFDTRVHSAAVGNYIYCSIKIKTVITFCESLDIRLFCLPLFYL